VTVAGTRSAEAPTRPAGSPARTERLPFPQRTRLTVAAFWVGVPLAIMLLCWRGLPLKPHLQGGVVTSWGAGMHMAIHYGVTFGNHLIFTYGPLGFLSVPTLWYSDTGTLAVLYTVLLRFALALAMFYAARRSYGTLGGAIVAVLVVDASYYALVTVSFLVFCVWMIDRVCSTRQRLALLAAGGALAGVELLNKISTGMELAAMAVVLALTAPGRRRDQVSVTVVAMLLGLLVAWTVSGQDLGALAAYVRNSEQVVSGYAAAMSYEEAGLAWQYVAVVLAFACGVLGALQMTTGGPRRRRWGIVALWAVFCFFEYKQGFVRHEGEHATILFVALMGGFVALRWEGSRRLVGVSLTAMLFVFAVAAQDRAFFSVADPAKNLATAARQFVQVADPSRRAAITENGRQSIQLTYPIDQATLRLLRGHTVHLEPYQTAIVWAYDLDWDPLPAFQSYVAYTSALDREDADALSSARAPQRILRNRDRDFDGRVQSFDQGTTTRAMLCRYQELRTTESWQVLGLGHNRCVGAPLSLGTVHAAWNRKVAVPAPPNDHSFVFVRIGGVQVQGVERLYGLLFKPAIRTVLLDGRSHRLVEGTAADGLVLRAPGSVDFTAPFEVAPDAMRIGVARSGGGGGGEPITFSFFAQSVSSGPRGGHVAA
jgi:hypothetical protein